MLLGNNVTNHNIHLGPWEPKTLNTSKHHYHSTNVKMLHIVTLKKICLLPDLIICGPYVWPILTLGPSDTKTPKGTTTIRVVSQTIDITA